MNNQALSRYVLYDMKFMRKKQAVLLLLRKNGNLDWIGNKNALGWGAHLVVWPWRQRKKYLWIIYHNSLSWPLSNIGGNEYMMGVWEKQHWVNKKLCSFILKKKLLVVSEGIVQNTNSAAFLALFKKPLTPPPSLYEGITNSAIVLEHGGASPPHERKQKKC